jgi:hypothetical protein
VEVGAPSAVEAGAPFALEFGVTGGAEDSLRLRARIGERVVGRTAVAPAGDGRLATGSMELRLDAPPAGGWVALVVELEEADAVPDDDRRTVHVHVAAETAGIVLLSLRPDWEPRFLAPVLEQALGLPLRGFLRGAGDSYVRLGGGLDAGAAASEADVRRALARAELLVLHGAGDDAPEWVADALRTARRILIFPAGAAAAGLPVQLGPLAEGDFYLTPELPASPVAALLAGQEPGAMAPLTAMRGATAPAGAWAPLLVTRGRQGQPQPAVLAGEDGGRRWAIALGTGYWQWAFRGGEERQLYTRLWGALGGWLARERSPAGPEPLRPALRSAPRGLPLAWVAPALAADSLVVTLTGADGAVALDTAVAFTTPDTAYTAVPAPGDYSYRVRGFRGDTVVSAQGSLTVESWSPEFARPAADLTGNAGAATVVRDGAAARSAGTPLHATPWPWVLVVVLLAAEWILRRRWGLR